MKIFKLTTAALMTLCMAGITSAGEYKVTGAHNCCGACSKAITEALSGVEGVTDITAKPKTTEISFTAPDDKTARKAVNKLGFAGFHGKVAGGKNVNYNEKNVGVEAGKVEKLTLVGVHNCCPGCSKSVDAAIAKIEGVESHKYTKTKKGVILTGNFDGLDVVKSLNEAGFHVRAPKPKTDGEKKKKAE
ncbi:MAG: heavy metal-associated domain-containing protein [Planctomycetaceae bacterium]|jgi:periplasmic mercuric ion binding protein|nr:heavy-metal-associated domain-containing protein [Planctomycetaceae bacterium]MDC0273221.1 heavy-metal-associated domain-containing protein [Planctomycetaceae bacterium]MDG2391754.1 heavy metal-associated domain-containing protein [Planctomycetaceae bacterium]